MSRLKMKDKFNVSGHSENKGRTLKHLYWEVSELDELRQKVLSKRAANMSQFSGLRIFM